MPLIITGSNKAWRNSLFIKAYNQDTGMSIKGLATKAGVPYPFARVWLLNRRHGNIVNAVSADASGQYIFRSLPVIDAPTEGYIVLGFDDAKTYDPEAKDFIQPEPD
ncbi:MAG: carboxypeptidase-like regulatory domain-containing protein [Methylococcaceae bacterium]|nr:carboxypeptidase-like regulatory domain-containing protein [Methylococcaceae bacterium]